MYLHPLLPILFTLNEIVNNKEKIKIKLLFRSIFCSALFTFNASVMYLISSTPTFPFCLICYKVEISKERLKNLQIGLQNSIFVVNYLILIPHINIDKIPNHEF